MMKTAEYQAEAEQVVKETAALKDFSYRGEVDLGRTWAITFSTHRDSELLQQSNFDTVKADLEKRFPKDVSDERFSHWAVGWIDHLLVRMLDRNGKVTKAGIAALEWKDREKDYPVLDEEDYSRRELEATFDNIKNTGSLDEATAQQVYDWLSEHNPSSVENRDDLGGSPSEEQIDNALKALGLLKSDDGEESSSEAEESEEGEEPPPVSRYTDPPEQMDFWQSR